MRLWSWQNDTKRGECGGSENRGTCTTGPAYSNGMPYGSEEFLILDTEIWEWEGIRKKEVLELFFDRTAGGQAK